MDYLSAAWTAVYYVAYPIFCVLNLILSVLAMIIAPLSHLGHYCLYACWYALCTLAKFETLYIFFGIATFVGIVTGTSLHYVLGFIISMLNLESSHEDQRGQTVASYRVEKQDRRDAKDPMMKVVRNDGRRQNNEPRWKDHMNWNISKQDRVRVGDRFSTILEEEDSSDGF